jgi:hypothetical protein
MSDTQDIFFCTEELSTHLHLLGKQQEINFEQINLEKEYFYNNDFNFKEKSLKNFIGDMDESTEIHSLLNPFDSTLGEKNTTRQNSVDNTETEEILAILRKKSATTPSAYSRVFSKSNPQFYEAKKIPMTGRIIEHANSEKDRNLESVSNFSLPVHSPVPVRPKCIPKRSITYGEGHRFRIKKEFCNELIMSRCEKQLDL